MTTVVDVVRTRKFLNTVERHLVPLRLKRRLVLGGWPEVCKVNIVISVVLTPIADLTVLESRLIDLAIRYVMSPSVRIMNFAVSDSYVNPLRRPLLTSLVLFIMMIWGLRVVFVYVASDWRL